MKKKGFTLIELLAVIVILAIISLIAVPTIMNIIEKTSRKSFELTANEIIRAGENYYTLKSLEVDVSQIEDVEFEIKDGKFEKGTLDVKSGLPKNGKITITKEGKIALAIDNDNYCITKKTTEDEITINDKNGECDYRKELNPAFTTSSDVPNIDICAGKGTCEVGTPFAIKVNDDTTYTFHVIKDEKNKLTLLMDRNLGDRVAWVSQEDYADDTTWQKWIRNNKGPITALKALEERTREWTNIPEMTYILKDEGGNFPDMTIRGVRARMLTYTEAIAIPTTDNPWSYKKVVYYGYWLSSSPSSDKFRGQSVQYNNGSIAIQHCYYRDYHVVPVIELIKYSI